MIRDASESSGHIVRPSGKLIWMRPGAANVGSTSYRAWNASNCGNLFAIGAVYLLASGSVHHLSKLQGGTAQIDRRRFRPNIYLESEAECGGFVEDSWLGGALDIGGAVRVEGFQPTVWCVTSTLAQQDLPRDLSILRTTAQHHRGCLGVYATVTKPGLLQVGDVAYLVNQGTDTARSMSQSA